jgi:hypothetical protein
MGEHMEQSADDQRATEHLMRVITCILGELYKTYPSQSPFSAESALLTAGILMLVDQVGRKKAAKAVHSLAREIERGGFEKHIERQRRTIQ